MELPYIAKLDIQVPDSVIKSLNNLTSGFYGPDAVNVTRHKVMKYGRLYLQYLKDEIMPAETNTDEETLKLGRLEQTKSLIHWANPDNEDIVVLRTFLDQHFNNYFQFTINFLEPHASIGRHGRHRWPRVFIPLHESGARFSVWDMAGTEYKMTFDLGYCYFFNTDHDHAVTNLGSNDARIMSSFCIDPRNNSHLF